MPAWGNHEWETPSDGRPAELQGPVRRCPTRTTSPGAPAGRLLRRGLGLVRRRRRAVHLLPRAVLELRRGATGRSQADPVFAAAQADPSINFIVTFGHRPAYSTGYHPGEADAGGVLDTLRRPLLEVRAEPQRALPRLRAVPCRSTASPTSPSAAAEPRSRRRGRAPTRGPPSARCTSSTCASTSRRPACGSRPCAGRRRRPDDMACSQGSVIDSYTIGANPPPPPPPPADPLRRQGERELLRQRLGHSRAAVLHDQRRRRRAWSPGRRSRRVGHLQRAGHRLELRNRHRTDHLRRRARHDRRPSPAGRPVSTCPAGAT